MRAGAAEEGTKGRHCSGQRGWPGSQPWLGLLCLEERSSGSLALGVEQPWDICEHVRVSMYAVVLQTLLMGAGWVERAMLPGQESLHLGLDKKKGFGGFFIVLNFFLPSVMLQNSLDIFRMA